LFFQEYRLPIAAGKGDETPDRLETGVDQMVADSGGKENGHAGFEFHGAVIVALRALAGEDVENLCAIRMLVQRDRRPRRGSPAASPGLTHLKSE